MEIYKITNTVNGKVYIGQTINGALHRFDQHIKDSRRKTRTQYFHSAIRKYGVEAFTVEVLATAERREDLHKLEDFYIKKFDARNRNKGYNIAEALPFEGFAFSDELLLDSFRLRFFENKNLMEISSILEISKDHISKIHMGHIRPHLKEMWEKDHGEIPEYRTISDEQAYEILHLRHDQNLTTYEIGEQLSFSAVSIGLVLRGETHKEVYSSFIAEHGEPTFRSKLYLDVDLIHSCLYQLFFEDLTIRETADLLDLSPGRIRGFLYDNNYPEEVDAWLLANNKTREDYNRFQRMVSDSTLLKCFETRKKGKTVDDVAARFEISSAWLQGVFVGRHRPHLLKQWLASGEADFSEIKKINAAKADKGARRVRDSIGNVFNNLGEASDYYDVTEQTIYSVLRGKKWRNITFEYLDPPNRKPTGCRVTKAVKLSDGREFKSVTEAAETIGVHFNTISRCLRTGRKLFGELEVTYITKK